MDRYLKQLGENYVPYADDRGAGYRIEFPGVGGLKVIRANSTPGASPKDAGWVAVSLNPDGTASHGSYYPSFRQLIAALNRD